MDLDDRLGDELRRRRDVVDERRQARDRASRELRRAGQEALEVLNKAGFTSGMIAKATGLGASTIRKLNVELAAGRTRTCTAFGCTTPRTGRCRPPLVSAMHRPPVHVRDPPSQHAAVTQIQ